jgi:hypothetical protein
VVSVPDPSGHLLDLIQRLRQHGFRETESSYDPSHFGNVLRIFERNPVRVRIVRDRGDWSAEMTAAGWSTHEHSSLGEEWLFLPPLLNESD